MSSTCVCRGVLYGFIGKRICLFIIFHLLLIYSRPIAPRRLWCNILFVFSFFLSFFFLLFFCSLLQRGVLEDSLIALGMEPKQGSIKHQLNPTAPILTDDDADDDAVTTGCNNESQLQYKMKPPASAKQKSLRAVGGRRGGGRGGGVCVCVEFIVWRK